jgi:hypothetical protein
MANVCSAEAVEFQRQVSFMGVVTNMLLKMNAKQQLCTTTGPVRTNSIAWNESFLPPPTIL